MKKAFILFALCLLVLSVQATDKWKPAHETTLRAPSVPLITSDTYLSIWSPYNELTEGSTEHWTGAAHPLLGALRVDGTVYRFMGKDRGNLFNQAALQKSVDVLPTQTYYTFTCGPVELDLIFTAPLLMQELDLISTPINYLSYRVRSTDRKQHNVQIYIETTPQLAVHEPSQPTVTESMQVKGMNYAKSGTIDQPYTVRKGDGVRIDWGYVYLGAANEADKAISTGNYNDMKQAFITKGTLLLAASAPIICRNEAEMPAMAYTHDLKQVGKDGKDGFIMLGYDDIYSLEYFYQRRQAYWKHNGKVSIFDAFERYQSQHAALLERCHAFDAELMANAEQTGGKEYAELCALVYRQAITAHKLFKDEAGNVLFFSKENHSNGCINTVDITYPSAPLFLLYNPDLLKGMMTSIFHYSESGRWTKPFPAHDLGTYPVANGMGYGGDMPIEEAGNMVILTAAISLIEGNADYAAQHWETLTTWANYLYENGLDPENQVCTDDFAGHLAHNANLSVKAILAIAGYSEIARMLGKNDVADRYMTAARGMAIEWEKMARDNDHYKLAFDKAGTWSQKYNLVWDKAFNTNIFPSRIFDKEMDFYLKSQHKYGTPLDSRKNYTKSDWIMWSACLRGEDDFRRMIAPVYLNAEETPSRVPISDWYDTDHGEMMNFKARSVVGGFFMKMLMDKMILRNIQADAAKTARTGG